MPTDTLRQMATVALRIPPYNSKRMGLLRDPVTAGPRQRGRNIE
ncbi:hypothetical protein [Nocardia salmonicida]